MCYCHFQSKFKTIEEFNRAKECLEWAGYKNTSPERITCFPNKEEVAKRLAHLNSTEAMEFNGIVEIFRGFKANKK